MYGTHTDTDNEREVSALARIIAVELEVGEIDRATNSGNRTVCFKSEFQFSLIYVVFCWHKPETNAFSQ